MSYEEFGKRAGVAISELRRLEPGKVVLVHHDDADGLCSAAVTRAALEREGFAVRALCLERAYPEVVGSLHRGEGAAIFYCDIGSSHADLISGCNGGRNLVVILDHHDPRPATDPRVHDLNLEHLGLRGETDFSGSTCCYLFAEALNEKNADLSYLALVGSCEIPGGLVGLNRAVLDEAVRGGVVRVEGKRVEVVRLGVSVDRLFSVLQVLGSVGYYEGGPELGVRACLEGLTEEVRRRAEEWEERRKGANRRLLGRLYREGLRETDHLQWFDAGDAYRGMGTKVVGTFCSYLAFQRRLVKPDKYILGLTDMSPEIPGYGRLKGDHVKASVRVPKEMTGPIDEGKTPSAVDLLVKASMGFGIADGHAYAASCTLPADRKQELIENAETIAKQASILREAR